jgi:predicted Zn-dependent protease with MMP-like domain
MTRERFRALVAEALDEIPEPFQSHVAEVEVVVEDEPSAELLRDMGFDPRRDTLFGLYDGVPLGERGAENLPLPDRIIIYFRPLVREFRTPAAIRREVKRTVIHEVAHFFGLDDDDIAGEGYA